MRTQEFGVILGSGSLGNSMHASPNASNPGTQNDLELLGSLHQRVLRLLWTPPPLPQVLMALYTATQDH